MEAIKRVYSVEILDRNDFDDCNYLKFSIPKEFNDDISEGIEVTSLKVEKKYDQKLEDISHKILDKFYNKELKQNFENEIENCLENHEDFKKVTRTNSNIEELDKKYKFKQIREKRPGYVINNNELPDLVIKHHWQRKLGNNTVTYMRDENGKLVSNSLEYRPFNLAVGETNFKYNKTVNTLKKPLRLFDKEGKPLTDKIGRPLLDIFGMPKVLIDSGGRPICDSYGNPVFNALGDSTVYADTDPTIPPIHEEDSILPLLDISKRHVVFLYDSKGNPLTDSVGRPLIKSSGSSIFHIQSNQLKQNQNCLKPLYGKSPIENVVRNIQIFDFNGVPLTNEDGVLLSDQSSSKIVCNDNGLPICDIHGKALGFKYGKRITLFRSNTIHHVNKSLCDSVEKSLGNKNSQTKNNAVESTDSLKEETFEYPEENNLFLGNKFKKQIFTNKTHNKRPTLLFVNKNFDTKKNILTENNLLRPFRKSLHTQISSRVYNDYGKPLRDHYNHLLYDEYGIPFTGENGVKLSIEARKILRQKLKNIPIPNPKELNTESKTISKSSFYDKYDSFGRPSVDKWGRPLYDLYGQLIYDSYGRPLTDAYGRPLTDSIGQPLLDNKGNILTAQSSHNACNPFLYDIFGRPTHDKFGNILFDVYGRPKYDIYTNSIFDNIGRPVTDANGVILKDSFGNDLSPYPSKPLYKNIKKELSFDNLISMPIMKKILSWKQHNLVDAFGGPLFDDYGRPMYSKAGKPFFDKYGRPLYDKMGKPLCDSNGKPLTEELRSESQSPLYVIDSLKLLKLSKDTQKWMETNESQMRFLTKNPDKIVRILQPSKSKHTKYIYALTRITMFPDGKRVLEILEAPLSPSTSLDIHRLPWDGKPVVMKAKKKEK